MCKATRADLFAVSESCYRLRNLGDRPGQSRIVGRHRANLLEWPGANTLLVQTLPFYYGGRKHQELPVFRVKRFQLGGCEAIPENAKTRKRLPNGARPVPSPTSPWSS